LQSSGEVYYLELDKDAEVDNYTISDGGFLANLSDLSLEKVGHGNKGKLNFEGFSVQNLRGESAASSDCLAVWAHRGDDKLTQGVIFWGTVDADSREFSCLDWHEVVVPWPLPTLKVEKHRAEVSPVRQISGLKVLPDGTLLTASALDPGDWGPFLGIVYKAGKFEIAEGEYHFKPCRGLELQELYRVERNGHKIEGMELLTSEPKRLAMITDDENFGPSIAVVAYSP
jgi:hypothetical protein